MTSVILAAAEQAEHHVEIPMHPIAYGLIAFGTLMVMLLVTMSYRGVSNRH
ncbi:hypothetical protein LWF01_09595 [Saxibacter everestensis]|uniref:Uncharacterized protein n=1 Tax=Saxibacter everestensis TaxID=2909229 RepID=A0ABY8R032_9MICO|nr:hypothetical protein LWF01_09595 [Brevibacteriaceae bacterium ZFBP1038]